MVARWSWALGLLALLGLLGLPGCGDDTRDAGAEGAEGAEDSDRASGAAADAGSADGAVEGEPERDADADVDEAGEATLELQIVNRERLASEEGTLTLVGGALQLGGVRLASGDLDVPWVRAAAIDLAADSQRLAIEAPVPAGDYDRVRVLLGDDPQTDALDARLTQLERGEVRMRYTGQVEAEILLEDGLHVGADGRVPASLAIDPTILTFYLNPYESADADGIYHPGEADLCIEQVRSNLKAVVRLLPR